MQITDKTSVGGVVFADASHIDLKNDDKTGKEVDTPPTGTGLDVKRFYLIVNHTFNDVWSANLTTDAQYSSATTTTVTTPTGTTTAVTGQNTSGGVTEVFIKKAYLQYKPQQEFGLRVGAADTPWVPWLENSLYGYRWVEKVTIDRLGFGTSADWGLNAFGSFGDHELAGYSVSVLNGGGYKNPTRTKDVDLEGRVHVKPIEWLTLGAGFYSGHLGQVTASNDTFPTNTATRFDGVVGVDVAGLRVGVEYFNAKNYKTVNNLAASAFGTSSIVTSTGTTPVSDKADGYSAWASYQFTPDWSVFARYDEAKLSKDVAANLKDHYANVGIAYKPLSALDVALVYKYEKVENGSTSVSGGNANGSYTIGGATGAGQGKFDEIGVYLRWGF
ncbi:MAG: hypothetical protein JOZ03_08605 [Gammaproteobacteria bacterium]|nr:hypothetical protein [Gammaproteobacteria bacterium]